MQVCLQASGWSSAVQFRAVALWALCVALGMVVLSLFSHSSSSTPLRCLQDEAPSDHDPRHNLEHRAGAFSEGEGLVRQLSERLSAGSTGLAGLATQLSESVGLGGHVQDAC
jgi:hypothetical protein